MKIKSGFMKRNIGNEVVVVPLGEASKTFRGIIKLNSTAAEIWDLIAAGQTRDEMVSTLAERYKDDPDANCEVLSRSVDNTITTLRDNGIIED